MTQIYIISTIAIVEAILLMMANKKIIILIGINNALIKGNKNIIETTMDYVEEKEMDKKEFVDYMNKRTNLYIQMKGEE